MERLAEIGEWMKVYGETIYGTRGGCVAPHPWGVTTQKGNKLYVHILDLQDKALFLPLDGKRVKKAVGYTDRRPLKIQNAGMVSCFIFPKSRQILTKSSNCTWKSSLLLVNC